MAYTLSFDIALEESLTGLTLEAQLITTAGANSGSALTTTFVEVGSGYYMATLSIPDGFRGGVKFQDSGAGTLRAFTVLNPQEAEFSDIKTSALTGGGGGGSLTIADVQTAMDNQGYSTARAALLDSLDAAISSRSTLDGTGVQSALTSQGLTTARAAKLDNLDTAVSTRSTLSSANVQSALTSQGVTTARAALLDHLNADITSRSTLTASDVDTALTASHGSGSWQTGTGGGGGGGITIADVQTALTNQGLTTARAALLDHLDADVSGQGTLTAADLDTLLTANHGSGSWQTSLAEGGEGITIADVQTALDNQGLTTSRATSLDFLDAAITSRSTVDTDDLADSRALLETELSTTHGAGSWLTAEGGDGGGGATGVYTVAVTVTDGSVALPDSVVTVKDASDTTTLDRKRTDASGVATFALDADTYKVSVQALPGYSSLAAQSLVVTANADVTYALPAVASGIAAVGTSTVLVYVYKPDGTPLSGLNVMAELVDERPAVSGALLRDQILTARTDATGLAELQLIRQDAFTRGTGAYRVRYSNGRGGTTEVEIAVPETSPVNIETLI